jgi:hypothetical protein
MKATKFAALAASISLATTSLAAPLTTYPIQTGAETQRFLRGVPTLNLELAAGAVLVTPLPLDHGSVSLGLAIYNKAGASANFGIENIRATVNGAPLEVFTLDQLESKAKNRAMWSAIGVAVLAGAAAAAVSSAHNTNTYRSRTSGPFGTVSHVAVWRDNSPGIIGATAATAAGVAGIVGIQRRLDYTLENLAGDIVQTTTIDPDASYGGRIVLAKPKAPPPYDVNVIINWNGADYPFAFRVTEAGKNIPAAYTTPPAALPTAADAVAGPAPIAAPAVAEPSAAGVTPAPGGSAPTVTPVATPAA